MFFVAKSWPAADRISRRSVPRRRGRGICGGYSIIAASVIASIVAAAWRVAAPSVSHSISSPGGATERPDDDRMREPRDSQSRERSLDRTVVQLRLATPPPPPPGAAAGPDTPSTVLQTGADSWERPARRSSLSRLYLRKKKGTATVGRICRKRRF